MLAHGRDRADTGRDRELAFTDYVRASAATGVPAQGEVLDRFLAALRGTLAHELRTRGLWSASPRRLGIVGSGSWTEGGDEALAELAQDCSLFILRRLPTLAAHAGHKPNVEGMVFRIIRNFLTDCQKHNDILGFRVYKFLRASVEAGRHCGHLRLADVRAPLDNHSLLIFEGAADKPLSPAAASAALEGWSQRWLPRYLPAIMRLGPRRRAAAADRLAEHLPELQHGGLRIVKFGALVGLWQTRARHHWAAIQAQAAGEPGFEGEPGRRVPQVGPEVVVEGATRFETRQAYQALRCCVEVSIEEAAEPERTRRRLLELWQALVALAAEEAAIPSNRALAIQLDIPRNQVGRLLACLRSLVERCRGPAS